MTIGPTNPTIYICGFRCFLSVNVMIVFTPAYLDFPFNFTNQSPFLVLHDTLTASLLNVLVVFVAYVALGMTKKGKVSYPSCVWVTDVMCWGRTSHAS